jgi:hypothetical protein
MKKLILLIVLDIVFVSFSANAQRYIYYIDKYADSTYGNVDTLSKMQRYNIDLNTIEDYPPYQLRNDHIFFNIDHSQSYLSIGFTTHAFTDNFIYNTTTPSDSFDLGNEDIDEILYSSQRNNLYIFSNDYQKIIIIDLLTKEITDTIGFTNIAYFNPLMFPANNSFFSSDQTKLYFYSKDNLNSPYQISTFSLNSKSIIQKRDLSTFGYSGKDEYTLRFGNKGKGIVSSSSIQNNIWDLYFRIYDFDTDNGSVFIHYNHRAEAYFTCDGEFLVVEDINYNAPNLYNTGTVQIYNSHNGNLVKSLSVPPKGIVYTFDNYPNDIYYVLNLDSANTQPTVYNLTKLKINSISPPLALAYWATPIQPNVLTITINGEFFTDSTVAYFNGNAKPTTFVSDSVVTFTLNSVEFRSAADYPVWVTNYGAVSDTVFLSVVNTLPNPVVPSVQCMQDNGNHTFTVHFNYNNQNTVPVGVVAAPPNNTFSPGNYYRGQPSVFLPGNHTNAFSVIFDGSGLTWTLLGNSVTANKYTIRCP